MKNLKIRTRATRQACALCKKKTGKLGFYLLIGEDKVKPYHAECKEKYEATKDISSSKCK